MAGFDRKALIARQQTIAMALRADEAMTWLGEYGDQDHKIEVKLTATAVQGHDAARAYVMRAAQAALPGIINAAMNEAISHMQAAQGETDGKAKDQS